MTTIQIIEIIAATIGILYVILEMRASIWLWPVGIVLPLFYIYISYVSKVYGNIIVNVYYLLACIWGLWLWLKKRKETPEEDIIRHIPIKQGYSTIAIAAIGVAILLPIFRNYTDSPYPIPDVMATVMSIVGMWLLAKKYIENWYCWIASNAIFCFLYFLQDYFITGCFFVIYTVIAVLGYFEWQKMMRKQQTTDLNESK